jgi:hypothetical protein
MFLCVLLVGRTGWPWWAQLIAALVVIAPVSLLIYEGPGLWRGRAREKP